MALKRERRTKLISLSSPGRIRNDPPVNPTLSVKGLNILSSSNWKDFAEIACVQEGAKSRLCYERFLFSRRQSRRHMRHSFQLKHLARVLR